MTGDWDTLPIVDEAALDSFATARALSRFGDRRYGTLTESLIDGIEVWADPPLSHSPHPDPLGERRTEPERPEQAGN